jgi:hypothetical protein
MTSKLLFPGLIPVVALSFILGSVSVQGAEPVSGPQPPASWTSGGEWYSAYFATPLEWQVRGEVIVDSGFRPFPNGFPFINYDVDFQSNQVVYGLPEKITLPVAKDWTPAVPVQLNANALRRTFGDGVCVKGSIGKDGGGCQLIRSAEILSEAISAQTHSGVCYGIASTVAALYNGQMNPNQVGSQQLPSTNNLNEKAQRTILRLFATQFFYNSSDSSVKTMNNSVGDSPNDVVEILKRDLAGGTVPYILALQGQGGGHAVTPYAIHERKDEGLIEIAVYDSDFPNLERAVLVDPVANTFRYSHSNIPGEDTTFWQGNNTEGNSITLFSVAETLVQRDCPVCIGPDQGTFIAFSSLDKENADFEYFLLNLQDDNFLPDSDYQWLESTNPSTGKKFNQKMIVVAPGVSYKVLLDGTRMTKSEAVELYVMANGKTSQLIVEDFKPGTEAEFIVDTVNSKTSYGSTKVTSPRVQEVIEVTGASLVLNGHIQTLDKMKLVHQRTDVKRGVTRFSSDSEKPKLWNIQATYEGLTRENSFVALNLRVVPKDVLVLKHKKWNGKNAPVLWLDRNGDGSLDKRVPMVPVTPELLASTKQDIYVSSSV